MLHNNKIRQKANCLYITLVREPIGRNFSAYFHNFRSESKLHAGDRKDPNKIYNDFIHNYQHSIPLAWLEREFDRELGVDVFKSEFDKERKYIHLEGSNTLIIRVDCPDEVKSDVISEMLGRRVTVGRKNDSANSSYVNLYRSVTEKASMPHEFVEEMYTSKYARHFWTDTELAEFRRKWINDRTATDLPSTVQSSSAA